MNVLVNHQENQHEAPVGDGLVSRSVRDEADVARFIALNEAVTGEGAIGDRLLRHHPTTTHADYLLVEDEHTGEAVSTICLMPWQCHFDGIVLQTAMLEMVVTHPAYRQRGLVRAQINRFHQWVNERGYDLSIIQGIPYYYRQYGYAYALDHTPLALLPAWRVPDAASPAPFVLRPATLADVDRLTALYDSALAEHHVYVQRDAADRRYLLQHADYPVRIVTDSRTEQAVGYLCVSARGQHLHVHENSITDNAAGWAVLRQLKTETSGEIQVVGSSANRLVRLARSLGSQSPPGDQWLLRLTDPVDFLRKIAPILDRRLAQAGWADLSADLCINFFRHALVIHIEQSRVQSVQSVGFVDASMGAEGGDLCIPPDAFVRLLFGYRTLDELQDAWPDIRQRPASRALLGVLFPRLTAHILMPY